MSLPRRLLNLFRSDRHSRDVDRELAFHLAERTDDLVAAGMTPADASSEARRRFGNYAGNKERTRDVDVIGSLDSFVGDLRYALRALRQSRGFALVAVLSLALGIGANTAIFTLINAVMLRTLPISHPEELVQLTMGEKGGATFTNPMWEQLRAHPELFNGAFAYAGYKRFNLAPAGETRLVPGGMVSGGFFRALGVVPAAGRLFTVDDDQRGCAASAVISYGLWQSEYGGDASAVGKTISVDAHPFRIIGVAQPGFVGLDVGRASQLFVPICADAVLRGPNNALDKRSNWWLYVFARVPTAMPIADLDRRLAALAPGVFEATTPPNWRADEQQEYRKRTLSTRPAANGVSDIRQEYRRALITLMVIVGLVLLIACANVANLLLARAAVREREMAVRVALGAGRARLVRQLLTESLVLSVSGALLGLLLAHWGTRGLVTLLSSTANPIFLDLAVDGRILAFSLGVATITGLAFGLVPAWRAGRVQPNAALKANARGVVEGQRRFTLGKALVVAQIAVSLTLIVGAGLLLGTFCNLSALDAGFSSHDVVLVSMERARGTTPPRDEGRVYADALRRLRALPGVSAASLSMITPLGRSSWNEEVIVDGFTPASADDRIAFFNEVSDGYFGTLRTPVLAGRDFGPDDRTGSPLVTIVNETMARKFYRTANPIGKTFRYQVGTKTSEPYRIIGVVKDAKYQSLREETLPTAFLPLSQDSAAGPSMNAELRVDGAALSIAPSVTAALHEIDPHMTLTAVPFETQVGASLMRERLLATLSGFFGVLALLLATMGLYGVMAYNVARRRNEIGIRMALGAGQRRVAAMVLREVSVVVCVGLGLGALLTVGATRMIAAFLFGLTALDVRTFGAAMALLAGVALVAAYLPVRRAARVDPMSALREE